MELNPYLKNAGVNRAFSEDAQFGKMMQSSMPVYFDSVIQKTHIEVDRHGTKAAAVTGIIAKAGAAPINKNLHIYLNRPFVYAIVDIENGMPFFMGVQSSIQ